MTRLWVARIGDKYIDDASKTHDLSTAMAAAGGVDPGVCFRSQNGATWNAEQFDDIKYNLNIAQFENGTMNLVYDLEDVSNTKLKTDPFDTQIGQTLMRVYIPNHGAKKGDKVRVNIYDGVTYRILAKTMPVDGQSIVSDTVYQALIKKVEPVGIELYDITVENMIGAFSPGQVVTISGSAKSPDGSIVSLNQLGTVVSGAADVLNGLMVKDLNKFHIVEEVDSGGSVIIKIDPGELQFPF